MKYIENENTVIRIEQGNATRKRLRRLPLNHLQQQRYNAIYHSKNAGIINTLIKINKCLSWPLSGRRSLKIIEICAE